MEIVKTASSVINESTDKVKDYAEHEFEYVKLRAFYQLATVSVGLSKKVIIGIFFIIFLLFGSVALSLYLGDLTESTAAGFMITSGIYLLIALVAYAVRSKIEKYVINKLSEIYFNS